MKFRILAIALSALLLLSGCTQQGMPANEWILEQHNVCFDLEQSSKSISDLFSLYLIEAIDPSDFKNELKLLIFQLQISQAEYMKSKDNIQPATHSYASKSGQEALDNAYNTTLDFLETTLDSECVPNDLIYPYLEWRDSFITYIATYLTAKSFIIENEGGT